MKIKKSSLAGIALALTLVAGTTTVFATNAVADATPKFPENVKLVDKITDFDNKDNTFSVNPDGNSFSVDRSMITGEIKDGFTANSSNTPFTIANVDVPVKPKTYTNSEMAEIIANIESGKIKPVDIATLPDDVTAGFVDSDGKEIVLKQSGAVKDGSVMDTLNSKQFL